MSDGWWAAAWAFVFWITWLGLFAWLAWLDFKRRSGPQ